MSDVFYVLAIGKGRVHQYSVKLPQVTIALQKVRAFNRACKPGLLKCRSQPVIDFDRNNVAGRLSSPHHRKRNNSRQCPQNATRACAGLQHPQTKFTKIGQVHHSRGQRGRCRKKLGRADNLDSLAQVLFHRLKVLRCR